MNLTLVSVSTKGARATGSSCDALVSHYVARSARHIQCSDQAFPSEAALLAWVERQAGRTSPVLVLLDRKGKMLASEGFASQLGRLRDSGAQMVVLAIGPPDGWSATARARANLLVSFGPITLPHELARVVLAEQVYRALTILAGHPYHSGH